MCFCRRGVRVLQRWWRREQARRKTAAIKLQAATRRFLAMRQLQRHKQAATLIQVRQAGSSQCNELVEAWLAWRSGHSCK